MVLFEKIVSELLNEDVQVGKINDAIAKTYAVKINYHSEYDDADGERIIQPVAYGLTKAGKPVIRAYQPLGDTKTKVPSWKFFLVSGIQTWKPLYKQVFHSPPADNFNPNGDKTMSTVYKVAKFLTDPNKNKINKNKIEPKTTGPITKGDIEQQHISVKDNPEVKKLEKLRKKLDNPTYISDIIKNKELGSEQSDTQSVDNTNMKADSGPVTKDSFKTQSEKDINSRYEQLNKNERVSQDVLNQWQKEQEKKNRRKNGSNGTRIK